jgi:hypothetical protein
MGGLSLVCADLHRRYLIVVNPMILLKMAGELSFPAEHDEDFSVRYKKWCPSCRAMD